MDISFALYAWQTVAAKYERGFGDAPVVVAEKTRRLESSTNPLVNLDLRSGFDARDGVSDAGCADLGESLVAHREQVFGRLVETCSPKVPGEQQIFLVDARGLQRG